MIGSSIIIKGEVTGDEDILIEGRVEGVINLNGNQVSIGESGDVSADIQASVVERSTTDIATTSQLCSHSYDLTWTGPEERLTILSQRLQPRFFGSRLI